MDQLKAYEILELKQDASKDEIKEAYARLSRLYHPEEEPLKFREINEAYKLLTRNRRTSVQINQNDDFNSTPIMENEDIKFNDDVILNNEDNLDFDSAQNQALQQEYQRLHELVNEALMEFKMILKPDYCNKIKLYKQFFNNDYYQEILDSDEFVLGLAHLLRESNLKKVVYDYIIDFYRLRGVDYESIESEAKALYDILETKRGIHTRNKERTMFAGLPIIVFMSIYRSVRNIAKATDMMMVLFVVGFIGLLMFIAYKLYKHFYENYSAIYSQAIVLVLYIIAHAIVVIFDLYAYLFGSDVGTFVALFILVICFVYLFVLGIIKLFMVIKGMFVK